VEHLELVLLFLLLAVIALTGLAKALRVPYPILLVVGGSALGFMPGVPDVRLDPDIVLLLFLPPLLFNAGYFASVRDLRRDLRVIGFAAVLLVLLTALAVGVAFKLAVPGVPWAVAFAFGAIVSPTDPLAAIAITQRLGVPRRLVTMIEGESLINDGTALVAYRTAVAAAIGGSFDLLDAAGDFVLNVAGGILVGLVAAAGLILVLRHMRDDTLGIALTLAAAYVGYLPAEHLGVSGVIAAVTIGLILGQRAHEFSSAGSRLRGYAFWDVLVFLLNASLFVLVGLQLPGILDSQSRSPLELAGLGALAAAAVIVTRFAFLFGMAVVIRTVDRRASQRARRAGWRLRIVAAWTGMRGAVSLAAALALPAGFPERDLIVFLTLCVIFATLVLQGLTLPALIRWLGVRDDGETAREELVARKSAARAALGRLGDLRDEAWTRADTIDRLTALYEFRLRRLAQRAGHESPDGEDVEDRSQAYQRLLRDLYDAQRDELLRLRNAGDISNGVMQLVERELDLEDQRLEI
jgi:CPA1 family monovalent cation:H+ antiporter